MDEFGIKSASMKLGSRVLRLGSKVNLAATICGLGHGRE